MKRNRCGESRRRDSGCPVDGTNPSEAWGFIRIGRIENAGNGHALHLCAIATPVRDKLWDKMDDPFDPHMSRLSVIPILRKADTKEVIWEVSFRLPSETFLKQLIPIGRPIELRILFNDVNGNEYETRYELWAGAHPGSNEVVTEFMGKLAPGVYLGGRWTTVEPNSRWFPSYR